MRLGGEDGVDVRFVESIFLHALEKKVDWRGVSEECVGPEPPVRRPLMRPGPSTMTEPESPLAENGPDLDSIGRIAHSLPLEVLALPSSK